MTSVREFTLAGSILMLSGLGNAPPSLAEVIDVPGNYATIQEAIDAAVDSDVVQIADGTHTGPGNKNLDFAGKAITVRSVSGDPALCIIDCQDSGRGFYFHSGESADAIVSGITVTNGYVTGGSPGGHFGGAVYCENSSSPTMADCRFTQSETHGNGSSGGGVACRHNSDPTFTNCLISGNKAYPSVYGGGGGGVFCSHNSDPTFIDSSITYNYTTDVSSAGGGIHCSGGDSTFINCAITHNDADYASAGGGAFFREGNPTLINCDISDNEVGRSGLYGSEAGGGIHCVNPGHVRLTNCLITNNWADDRAGAIYCSNITMTLTNCTILGNTTDQHGDGSAVRVHSAASTVTMTNSILWNGLFPVLNPDSATLNFTYSNIEGGWDGTGNISATPQFVTDYHLGPGSPCIDAGNNEVAPADAFDLDGDGDTEEPIPVDIDGNARFVDDPNTVDTGHGTPPIVDMGVHEFQASFGDLDLDGDTDLDDFAIFAVCLSGSGQPVADGCEATDQDGDGDADLADFAPFQVTFGNP